MVSELNKLKGANILITGGAGFIGSHLAEKLLLLKANVTIVDNFLNGSKIEHLRCNKLLIVHNEDVRNKEMINNLSKGKDIVLHLAAVVGVEEANSCPLEVLNTEIMGTVNVFNAAIMNEVGKVIFVSSSEVYGDCSEYMYESMPLTPKSVYATAKVVGEEYCKSFNQKYGITYTILRYFNVYGSRQDERFAFPRFISKILNNNVVYIYGDGNQSRDFTYIDDAVNMTLLSAINPNANNQTINIGTGVKTTLNYLVSAIGSVLNKDNIVRSYIDYDNKRPYGIEVFNRVADTSKSTMLLGCKVSVNLESGIKKILGV